MNRWRVLYWGLFFILSSCSVKKSIQSTTTLVNPYSAAELINDSIINTAHIGIALFDADHNNYLYQYQSNKYYIPASNTKIMTCYAAMKYLGDSLEGLKYEENKTGDITVRGTGDPTFLHPAFKQERVYDFLRKQNRIAFYVSNTLCQFKPFGKGWTNDDYYEDYMNERSEFPVYGNNRKVFSNLDTAVYFKLSAPSIKDKYCGGTGLQSTVQYISDTTAKEVPYYLKLLMDTLGKKDFKTLLYSSDKLINIIYSQATDSVLQYMMHNSDNFFAEQLLLMVSNKQLGVMNDIRMFDTLLATDYKGFPQKPRWADACGLSRYNLFTPEDIVYVLGKIKMDFKEERINTIFPSGNQGTLMGYYINNADNIHAKTGSMNGVFCLSGFLTTKQYKHITFSVMVNNHQAKGENLRRKIEAYLTNIIEQN